MHGTFVLKSFTVTPVMVVIQMVASCVFNVTVKSSDSVQMCSFLVVMQHLQDVDGAKGVCFFMEVFCEVRSVAVAVESSFVFIVTCGEASSSLPHPHHITSVAGS